MERRRKFDYVSIVYVASSATLRQMGRLQSTVILLCNGLVVKVVGYGTQLFVLNSHKSAIVGISRDQKELSAACGFMVLLWN